MTILFDDPLPDLAHFAWSAVPSPQVIGEPFPVAITAQAAAIAAGGSLLVTIVAALVLTGSPPPQPWSLLRGE